MSEDERTRAKNAILARRARFIAAALGSAALTASCGGKVENNTSGDGDGDRMITPPDVCLSICLGICLQPDCNYGDHGSFCDPYGTGGFGVCLGAPCLTVCLEPPWGGFGGTDNEAPNDEEESD